MQKLRVQCFAISIDGFGAGPNQDLANPLGVGGPDLHQWFFPTDTFKQKLGEGRGTTGIDNDFAKKGFENIGAWILGRNMFGPVRGPWPDESWKGWWGDSPPYHCEVFVLSNHARKSFSMEGGTTFHFITDGIESAYKKAMQSARGKDVRLGGGVSTIQQYLKARLIDELHLVISPAILGSGERLLEGIDLKQLGYSVKGSTQGEKVMHVIIEKG
ncbi:MAG: dihydrofolate reductase family protein [Cyclobacteriaceae bacterium]